jgi:S1-C subfamily serine protease
MADQTVLSPLQGLSQQLAETVESVGTGVVRVDDGSRLTASGLIWEDGVILTTSHGVEQDDDLAVELHDGRELTATLIGRDEDTDIALLRVKASGLSVLPRASTDEAKVGHLVLALGRPGNGGLQATIGIISAKIETQSAGQNEHVLHTDAVLYPGFSGGALADTQGRVVGLLNRGFGRGNGVALGIPLLENVTNALLTKGSVTRGFLGVSAHSAVLTESVRQALGNNQERGLLLVAIGENSAAEKGGLIIGDVLLAVNGTPVEDPLQLRRHLRSHAAGESVTLRLLRGGALQEISVILGSEA